MDTSIGRGSLLIDTGAFIALADVRDRLHSEAAALRARLPRSVRRVTTQAVVGETYTFLRYHVSGYAARAWLDTLAAARRSRHLTVICTDDEDGEHAERILRRFPDQALSYVDGLTLAVAERYDAGAIFAFDNQLRLGGRPLLPLPARP